MRSELDLMTQWGEIGVTCMECSMHRLSISSEMVFITKLSAGNHSFMVLLDNQATVHEFKSEALVSKICPNGETRNIGGIDGSHSGISNGQICDVPHVGVGYYLKNAGANILSWSKRIKLGMDLDYFKASDTFVLYDSDTT